MLCSSVCVALGQLLWKLSGGDLNFQLFMGFFLYGAGAMVMIIAYQHGSLSVLHPLLSTGYILSVILGYLYLQESLGPGKLLGIAFISIGVVLISGGDDA